MVGQTPSSNLSPKLKVMNYGLWKLIIDELKKDNEFVADNYFKMKEKLVRKRARYGIDCRVVPDNQLYCIYMDDEVFNLMFSDRLRHEERRAIFRVV